MIAQVENFVNEQNTKCEEYDSCDINYLSESAKVKSDLLDEEEHFSEGKSSQLLIVCSTNNNI